MFVFSVYGSYSVSKTLCRSFHKQKKIEGKKEDGDRKREEGWKKEIKKQIRKEITQKEITDTHAVIF